MSLFPLGCSVRYYKWSTKARVWIVIWWNRQRQEWQRHFARTQAKDAACCFSTRYQTLCTGIKLLLPSDTNLHNTSLVLHLSSLVEPRRTKQHVSCRPFSSIESPNQSWIFPALGAGCIAYLQVLIGAIWTCCDWLHSNHVQPALLMKVNLQTQSQIILWYLLTQIRFLIGEKRVTIVEDQNSLPP